MSTVTVRREIELDDLCGLPAGTAVDRLRAVELKTAIEPVDVVAVTDHGRVIDHDPEPRARVRRGQLVTLLVGQSPHAVTHPGTPTTAGEPPAPAADDTADEAGVQPLTVASPAFPVAADDEEEEGLDHRVADPGDGEPAPSPPARSVSRWRSLGRALALLAVAAVGVSGVLVTVGTSHRSPTHAPAPIPPVRTTSHPVRHTSAAVRPATAPLRRRVRRRPHRRMVPRRPAPHRIPRPTPAPARVQTRTPAAPVAVAVSHTSSVSAVTPRVRQRPVHAPIVAPRRAAVTPRLAPPAPTGPLPAPYPITP